MFLDKNPKAYLLLHTCWSEDPHSSWNIPSLIKDRDVDSSRILTTYVCRACGNYSVRPFEGEQKNCSACGKEKSVFTTSPQSGVTEAQLNEIYNLMDVYCHPFTSGGQEYPVQESKLTELITLVTDYACGEEHCTPESGGLPLDWEPYFEPGTNFKKATTLASSIFTGLLKVWKMPKEQRAKMGKTARKFIVENYGIEKVGKQWEEILDSLPYVVDEKNFDEKDWL
jgi:glycosyltransferase involved in cell wall biosynthesis